MTNQNYPSMDVSDWDDYPAPDWNDLPEPVYPYHCTVEEQIDGTHVIVSTECGGTERLDEKVKRLISSEKEEICA